MKDEYKILIGAVVVILIVLIGAFALSGSNNPGPTATPTVIPVTATPTAVPAGNGGSNGGTPSANPTVAPTVAPTVVPPSPTPESGVKQTEFGYWITYPPLGPQNWSNPKPRSQNYVEFDPTLAWIDPSEDEYYADTSVYRIGDKNPEVDVIIRLTTSNNIQEVLPALAPLNYMCHAEGENLIPLGDGYYKMTFGPGDTENDVRVFAYRYLPGALQASPTDGWVQLTIVNATGGYSPGADRNFYVDIGLLPDVWFGEGEPGTNEGDFWMDGTAPDYSDYIDHFAYNGSMIDVFIPMGRDYGEDAVTVKLSCNDEGDELDNSQVMVSPATFTAGQLESLAKVSISRDYLLSGNFNRININIEDGGGYKVGSPDWFWIWISRET